MNDIEYFENKMLCGFHQMVALRLKYSTSSWGIREHNGIWVLNGDSKKIWPTAIFILNRPVPIDDKDGVNQLAHVMSTTMISDMELFGAFGGGFLAQRYDRDTYSSSYIGPAYVVGVKIYTLAKAAGMI